MACLTLLAFPAIAQAFVIDSLEYKVTDEAKNEVAVSTYTIGLSGDVTIPTEVEYEGVKYKVTSIGDHESSLQTNAPDITKIYASEGIIIIEGFTSDISVFNPAGQLILRRTTTDPYTEIAVKAGLYMVTAGENSGRVIVR